MSADSEFYTRKEIARLLGVSVNTVTRYTRRKPEKGGLPFKRFSPRCIRISKSAFKNWAGLNKG